MSGRSHTEVYIGNPRNFHGFDQKEIRSKFVSKVYSILGTQLLFTTALIGLFVLHEPTKEYFSSSSGDWYLIGSAIFGIVIFMVIVCCDGVRRAFPGNFVLLCLLTLAYGMVAAILSSRYDTFTVMTAIGTTAFATFVIILLAKFSPFDLTTCGCGLCILALVHLLMTILLTIILVSTGNAKILPMILAGMGSFVISIYMMYDLQLIMGGRRAELSPEEYILGAALLYVDIVQLFQYMLILLGRD